MKILIAIILLLSSSAIAYADKSPTLIYPGTPNSPIPLEGPFKNGVLIYGDWGLNRPGAPIIIEPLSESYHVKRPELKWYPRSAKIPVRGRFEDTQRNYEGVDATHPQVAEPYHREWFIQPNIVQNMWMWQGHHGYNPPPVIYHHNK